MCCRGMGTEASAAAGEGWTPFGRAFEDATRVALWPLPAMRKRRQLLVALAAGPRPLATLIGGAAAVSFGEAERILRVLASEGLAEEMGHCVWALRL